jgi:ADP-heptose:LPS heptosyltransferase
MKPIYAGCVRLTRSLITRAAARPVMRKTAHRYRAVLFKVDRLGDFVLAISAIRLALAYYGEGRCLLVVSPAAERLAEIEFPRTPRLVLPAAVGHKRLLSEGRKARGVFQQIEADVAVCFRYQRWDWDELLLLWLGASQSYVLDDATGRRFFADRNTYHFNATRWAFESRSTSRSQSTRLCLELQRHQQLLTHVLGRPISEDEVLPTFTRVAPAQTDCVVVAPFGSAAIRDFPTAALESAIFRIRAISNAPIVLCGDLSQQMRLRQLLANWHDKGITNASSGGAMAVDDFVQLIGGAQLVLTVETATAHLAAAFDRRVLIAIGGGHYGEFGPWSRSAHQQWLTHEITCIGCNWQCGYPEPYCLTRIDTAVIVARVTQLLQGEANA